MDNNECARRYRLRHPERVKASVARYALTHPEVIKRRNQKWNARLIKFKDKRLARPDVCRLGVCTSCKRDIKDGEIKRTVLHHFTYDYAHPSWYVTELCLLCHAGEHARLMKLGWIVPEINKPVEITA